MGSGEASTAAREVMFIRRVRNRAGHQRAHTRVREDERLAAATAEEPVRRLPGLVVWLAPTGGGALGRRKRAREERNCPGVFLPNCWSYYSTDRHRGSEFSPYGLSRATFVNCSHEINDHRYGLVRCLSTSDSFIYVLTGYHTSSAQNFKPSCGYLAMTPLDDPFLRVPENASYEDVVKFMRNGFVLGFPPSFASFRDCLVGLIQ
ncbi:hypothetical protein EJB05_31901, partial [Eragrostis curvula]